MNETATPRTVDEVYEDFMARRSGLVKALTSDVDEFYAQCDPEKDNLCLYGNPDGSWEVTLPAEEVPPELPEPALGINFARDGMQQKDWLALVAVHSDAWLMAVAFYFGAKFDQTDRERLFKKINTHATVYKTLSGEAGAKANAKKKQPSSNGGKRTQRDDGEREAYDKPSRGKVIGMRDSLELLHGATIELFWPDDGLWYRADVLQMNLPRRQAKVLYTTGDVENLDLDEVIKEGHLNVVQIGAH